MMLHKDYFIDFFFIQISPKLKIVLTLLLELFKFPFLPLGDFDHGSTSNVLNLSPIACYTWVGPAEIHKHDLVGISRSLLNKTFDGRLKKFLCHLRA